MDTVILFFFPIPPIISIHNDSLHGDSHHRHPSQSSTLSSPPTLNCAIKCQHGFLLAHRPLTVASVVTYTLGSAASGSESGGAGTPRKRRVYGTRTAANPIPLTERQQLTMVKKKTEEEALLLNVKKRNASGVSYHCALHALVYLLCLSAPLCLCLCSMDAAVCSTCVYHHSLSFETCLQNCGALVNWAGETPLHQMVIKGNIDMVSRLIDRNAPVNSKVWQHALPALVFMAVSSPSTILRIVDAPALTWFG